MVTTRTSFNAITDVAGVEVGFTTLISGEGKLVARDAALAWMNRNKYFAPMIGHVWFAYPLVAETYDRCAALHSGFHSASDAPGEPAATAPATSSWHFRRQPPGRSRRGGPSSIQIMSNDDMNGVMDATVDATEEAIINALGAAKIMTGANGSTVFAIPHDQVRDILKKYGRLR